VTTAREYDLNGNLTTVIDASGRRTHYQYDALDRRRAAIYPDDSRMLTDYDHDSNIIRTEDNNGLQRIYTVDVRTAIVNEDKLQIVTGAAMPIGLNRKTDNFGAFLYLSIEHDLF
jgi:YD repeat-containing protein